MNGPGAFDTYLFDRFRLHRRGGGLLLQDIGGTWTPVDIGSRALDVLGVLVERHGEVVSRDEIMRAVWPQAVVEEHNLTVQISTLRRVLDDGRPGESCIKTISGRGYLFAQRVTPVAEVRPDPSRVSARDGIALSEAPARSRRWTWPAVAPGAAGILVGVVLLGVAGSMWLSRPDPLPAAYSPQDRRLSVIVLPFENSSGDLAQDGVAEAITRDLTDVLAQDPADPVVPAATAAAYRGKPLDLPSIGRDHDVHFALLGNARRQDGHLIAVATLYETATARQLWSQRFDSPATADAGRVILHQIESGFTQAAMDEEAARAMREHLDNLDKRDLMFAAMATSLFKATKKNNLAALALMERAIALDPDYVWALREDARMRTKLVFGGYSADPEADLAIATKLVDRALLLKINDPWTLREKANVLRAKGDLDGAAALLHRVIELLPLQAFRYRELGVILMMQGHYQEALENIMTARRLVVGEDAVETIDGNVAMGLLVNDRFPEAITESRLAIAEFAPDSGMVGEFPWLTLIAAESANGDDGKARGDLQTFLATPRTLRTMAAIEKNAYLAAIPKLLDGLRQAGMPAEEAANGGFADGGMAVALRPR